MELEKDPIRPRMVSGSPGQPPGDSDEEAYAERLRLLQGHVARGRTHANPTWALLELAEADFMLVQAALGHALGKRLSTKAPSEEELAELMPLIVDMTKVGKTIASLEKMLQRHRRELPDDS